MALRCSEKGSLLSLSFLQYGWNAKIRKVQGFETKPGILCSIVSALENMFKEIELLILVVQNY